MTLSRCKCQKALFAAIAQNFGREGLHIMTACIRSAHESCGTRRITVDGADDDIRNALAIASDGVHRRQSGALSVASPASVRFQTRDKCGSGRLRLATDMTEPGERQGRRGGELRAGNRASWHLLRDKVTRGRARSGTSRGHFGRKAALFRAVLTAVPRPRYLHLFTVGGQCV